MDYDYDIIIVGASLAGASAAIELGKNQLKVALFDKATFPRRKPCGEGLSPLGIIQLERLGIKERILNLPHLPYQGYNITVGHTNRFIPSPVPGGITLQRRLLDTSVLNAALDCPSVIPFLNSKVENITGNSVLMDGRELSARRIILACGSNSPLIKKIPCRTQRFGPRRTGVSALYRGEYSRVVNWITILVRDLYEIYCTPLADSYLNISVLKNDSKAINIASVFENDSLMKDIFERCFFNGSQVDAPEGRTSIGNVRRESELSNIILAGDAKEEFDPIGGMGMSHALSSGIAAAHHIIKELSSPLAQNLKRLNKEHVRAVHSMRMFTHLTYGTLIGAKYLPSLLNLSASRFGNKCMRLIFENRL